MSRKLHLIRVQKHSTPVTLLLHSRPVFQVWKSHAASHLLTPSLLSMPVEYIVVVFYWLSCFHVAVLFSPYSNMVNIWDGTGCLKSWCYQFVFLRRHRCPNMHSPRALNILLAQSAQHYIYVYTIIICKQSDVLSQHIFTICCHYVDWSNWIICREESSALIKRKASRWLREVGTTELSTWDILPSALVILKYGLMSTIGIQSLSIFE